MEKKSLIIGIAAVTVAATAGGLLFIGEMDRNSKNSETEIISPATNTTAENINEQKKDEPAPIPWQSGTVMIDFAICQPQIQMVYVDLGSVIYEIKGLNDGMCAMNYGGEIENPDWDRKLTNKCQVPVSLGQASFNKTEYGIDFSPIEKYCNKE